MESFIENIKEHEPALWVTLKRASLDGLVLIDEENDSVIPTNRLLLTYPDLHEALSVIINSWSEKKLKKDSDTIFNQLTKDIDGTN